LRRKKMGIGKACAIFKNIHGYECSVAEKYQAICMVADMATHNGFKKQEFIDAIKWMFAHPDREADVD
jgi:hypothetical protein